MSKRNSKRSKRGKGRRKLHGRGVAGGGSGRDSKLSGGMSAMRGENEDSIEYWKKEVARHGEDGGSYTGLANAYSVAAKYDLALEAGLRAIALNAADSVAHYLVVYALEQLGRVEESLLRTGEAIECCPDDGALRVHHGHLLGRSKRYEEALGELENVLSGGGELRTRQRAIHEKGMILDRMGRYDEAYECFVKSGEMTKGSPEARSYDRAVRLRKIHSYRASLSKRESMRYVSIRGRDDCDNEDEEEGDVLSFLVGFPRSGTTMTEQILAAHPDITTGDELPFLTDIGREAMRIMGGRVSPAALVQNFPLDEVHSLRESYCFAMMDYTGGNPGRVFVDKMPLNIIELPFIQLVFPDAKIIVALRDPRDVCLSCFMQDFRLNNSMIHFLTLEDTVAFYCEVMGLYLDLKPKMSLDVVEIRYEDTVGDLEGSGRRLLGHLGVEWNDDILSFHEKARERMISTPSAAAVREPIHQRAVSRWKNYARYFEPLQEKLRPFVEAFGYVED